MNLYARIENKTATWKIDMEDHEVARELLIEKFAQVPTFRGPVLAVIDGGIPVREPE